jgi:CheY-like chemotaxis protein
MSTKPLSGIRVLILDDHADSLEAMCFLLTCYGATVRGASNAREALTLVAEFRPDALISDLMMPGDDGYAFIAQVRALAPEQGGLTPAIAYSALAEGSTRAVEAGYQRYIRKPAAADQLVDALALLARPQPNLRPALRAREIQS